MAHGGRLVHRQTKVGNAQVFVSRGVRSFFTSAAEQVGHEARAWKPSPR
jgi:hypothetical protein